MPTYEYECRTCGFSFEKVQNMSDDPVKECPQCGKEVRRLIFGGSGVIFKGSGFYVNDSRGKNPAAPATAKQNASGSDSSSSGGSEQKKAPAATGTASGSASTAGTGAATGKSTAGD